MFIIIGMPCGRQYHDGTLPIPPAAISALLASNTAWYSGVTGGGDPPGTTQPGAPTRCHWPLKSGYFDSSEAWAAVTVSAAASAMTIELRCSISVLPAPPGCSTLLAWRTPADIAPWACPRLGDGL